jgi:hypothetical protein
MLPQIKYSREYLFVFYLPIKQSVSKVSQSELRAKVQGNPDVGAFSGCDHNSTVDVDNLKVLELVPGFIPRTLIQANGQAKVMRVEPGLTAECMAKLQSATMQNT